MRILVITNMYPPHHYGGYELCCEDMVQRFRANGHRVSVLTSTIHVPGVESAPQEESLGVWRQLEPYWHDHVLLSPPILARLGVERTNQRALDQALARAQPDVVSIWNIGALSLGLLTTLARRALPVVFVIGDNWPAYAQQLDAWSRLFRSRLRRPAGWLVERVTGVPSLLPDMGTVGACCFISEVMRKAAQELSGWTLHRTGIVYWGIEEAHFPIAADDAEVGDRPWRWQLLYVGRLDERKGIDTLLQALPHVPTAHLRIVGRGDNSYLARLRDLADRLAIADRVAFSVAPRDQLAREYRQADALVFPSVYEEPFGLVPLEAMACDAPVVATGQGGSGEYLVEGANALLFRPGDRQDLVDALRRLAGDPTLRTRLIRGGRRTARALTTAKMFEALSAWHEAAAVSFALGQPGDHQLPLALHRDPDF
jgi:glycosyltransferase involved in cell wall biosynthesis